jgi:hypothetical protein
LKISIVIINSQEIHELSIYKKQFFSDETQELIIYVGYLSKEDFQSLEPISGKKGYTKRKVLQNPYDGADTFI